MESVLKGRKIVIGIIITILLIDFITIAVTSSLSVSYGNIEEATYNLMQGIFRFILECLLLFFLYKGHKWAKWTILILFFLGGLFSLISLLQIFNIFLLFLGLIYISIGITLLKSSSVKDFLRYQKDKSDFGNGVTNSHKKEQRI